jgi:glutathione synthase/RimK-type ligase-like ATP-grasp enzyme
MKLALATCSKQPDLHESDIPLIALFKQYNINAEAVIWNNPDIEWQVYDAVLIRSVWDYHLHETAFTQWLKMLEQTGIYVLNPASTLLSNRHKFYLQQLEKHGINIIPTAFIPRTESFSLPAIITTEWNKAVIKPAVSAGSYLTKVFTTGEADTIEKEYSTIARERDLLIQPFLPEVISNGEISLLYFNRQFSHAVLKTPKQGDFRVQQEFGGHTVAYTPTAETLEAAGNILQKIPGELLYARVDGVILNGQFALMELELIEPYLFFDYKQGAIELYVKEASVMLKNHYHTK